MLLRSVRGSDLPLYAEDGKVGVELRIDGFAAVVGAQRLHLKAGLPLRPHLALLERVQHCGARFVIDDGCPHP